MYRIADEASYYGQLFKYPIMKGRDYDLHELISVVVILRDIDISVFEKWVQSRAVLAASAASQQMLSVVLFWLYKHLGIRGYSYVRVTVLGLQEQKF